jgi:leucyl-tRNA synthetase
MSGDYNPNSIEPKWQKHWTEAGTFVAKDFDTHPKFYSLFFFPYPSASGLHVGHAENYVAPDILARYKRANGYNVLQPTGWDAFGLPAEQYALKTGKHPKDITTSSIDNYRRQIQSLGIGIDWNREVNTTDPEYFRWTQWIFQKLFEKGLAYVDERPVWWCPALETVLANEEIVDGKSEVGGHPVERRNLRQWVLKITAYADRLESGLKDVDWPESTKKQQIAWIGRSEGANISFAVEGFQDQTLNVYTTRPDTLFGVTFMVIAPEHPLVERLTTEAQRPAVAAYIKTAAGKSDLERTDLNKDKTGVFTGSYAVNPVNGKRVAVWIGDYVLGSYGTGAVIGVPAHDERDYEFAARHGIDVIQVIQSPQNEPLPYVKAGTMVNSGKYDGMPSEDAKVKIVHDLSQIGTAKPTVNYKLRDWLFSRQHYWGEPFPILWLAEGNYRKIDRRDTKLILPPNEVSCSKDGVKYLAVCLPEDQLPLTLPTVKQYKHSGTGESPLASMKEWTNVFVDLKSGRTSSKPEGPDYVSATRETNTMPQWAGSCWYYLRFLDPNNKKALVDPQKLKYWGMPDLYIGGAAHAVLHLLYARFWHQFLYDIGVVTQPEPFPKLFHQGIILGEDSRKMSKSLGNVVNPDDISKEYGADTLRMYLMFMGPLEDMKPWSSKGIGGIAKFLKRVYREFIADSGVPSAKIQTGAKVSVDTDKTLHASIKKISADIESMKFNTAISQLMVCFNQIQTEKAVAPETARTFIQLLAPFAPHLSEEIWSKISPNTGSVGTAKWPAYDESKLLSAMAKVMVQVNGKVRGEIVQPVGTGEAETVAAARSIEKVKQFLGGQEIKKVFYVKDRLLNLVVSPSPINPMTP